MLVLLALPGAVLLALSLFGLEAPANAWLRRPLSEEEILVVSSYDPCLNVVRRIVVG